MKESKLFMALLVLIASAAVWALDTTKTKPTVHDDSLAMDSVTVTQDPSEPFEITTLATARCWYLDEDAKQVLCITESLDPKNNTVHVSQQLYTRGNGK